MKVHKLAVWFLLPMLAGCSSFTQQSITPPAGLNAQQKAEWSTSQCIRMVKEKRPWHHKFVSCRCAYRDFHVTLISPDGTALARYKDAVMKPASAFKSVPAAVRKTFTEWATQKQYLLQAADGGRYPYHVTALAADCESAILKPVKPIPPQPYIDISRMAVPQLGQSYRGIVGVYSNQPIPLKLGTITVKKLVNEPVSVSSHLLFRDSDGSFAGFTQFTETGYHAGENLKPLQKFIEANSSVRFGIPPQPKPEQPVKP